MQDVEEFPKLVGGRPRLYPLHLLAPGESMTLPWLEDEKGFRLRDQDGLHAVVRNEQRRHGRLFKRRPSHAGLVVIRWS